MNLKTYLTSLPGRVALGSVSFAFLGAAVVAIAGPGTFVDYYRPLHIALTAVGFITAVGLTIGPSTWMALAMVLLLPFLGGPYFVLMRLWVPKAGGGFGALFLYFAWLGAQFAVEGYRDLLPKGTAPEAEDSAAAGGH